MKKERTLFFVGIWVALLPHLGFPDTFRKILFLLTGLFIILVSYVMYKRKVKERTLQDTPNDVMHSFNESLPSTDISDSIDKNIE